MVLWSYQYSFLQLQPNWYLQLKVIPSTSRARLLLSGLLWEHNMLDLKQFLKKYTFNGLVLIKHTIYKCTCNECSDTCIFKCAHLMTVDNLGIKVKSIKNACCSYFCRYCIIIFIFYLQKLVRQKIRYLVRFLGNSSFENEYMSNAL